MVKPVDYFRSVYMAARKSTEMRHHLKLVTKGVNPSPYTEFDKKVAKVTRETSGAYSKNPINKIISWVKEFIFNFKSDMSFLKHNPPLKQNEALDKMAFEATLNAVKGKEGIHFS